MNPVLPDKIDKRVFQKQCSIGAKSFCCKECLMGPCHFNFPQAVGVCGAKRELIVSRNLLRMIVGGTASHCGHAQHLLDYFSQNVSIDSIRSLIPEYLQRIWEQVGIKIPESPTGHFKSISEAMHLSSMGVNSDYVDILKWCLYMGILDGYFGMYLATMTEDEHFGKPKIQNGDINLGCIDPSKVNIAIHGHEPMLAEAIVQQAKKFKNVNLIGVCCTGASLLARHNVPHAAHFLLQEDVIATGMIEAMVVDAQCIMPSLSDMCECFHTNLITTSHIGRMTNALHLPFTTQQEADEVALKILENAIANRVNRNSEHETYFKSNKPKSQKAVVGFSDETVPINNIAKMLENKSCKGVIAVVGCVNPRSDIEQWVDTFYNLSSDYIILTTGCMAFEFGNHGFLDGKRFFHLGSCVNNSRVAEVFRKIALRLNKKIHELPFLVSAPAPITEKSLAIGMFFAAIGSSLHVGQPSRIASDPTVASKLISVLHDTFGSKLLAISDPEKFKDQLSKDNILSPVIEDTLIHEIL
jgi:carbon-monoxide dehydrogenase catalytic subunit